MINLMKLQFTRTTKHKAVWVYLVAMTLILISNSLSLQNPDDVFHHIYSGGKFPISALQSQASMVAPLFFALVAAFSVNGEKTSGVFKQPLLSGITKTQLLNCKLLNIVLVMFASVLLMGIASFVIGFAAWGSSIFDNLLLCFLHIGLTMIPLTVSCMGFILLALYTPNAAVTMCAAFFILLADNLVSQFFVSVVSNFSYMYYAYAYSGFNAQSIEMWMISKGLTISLITGVVFYFLAYRRIYRMPL